MLMEDNKNSIFELIRSESADLTVDEVLEVKIFINKIKALRDSAGELNLCKREPLSALPQLDP